MYYVLILLEKYVILNEIEQTFVKYVEICVTIHDNCSYVQYLVKNFSKFYAKMFIVLQMAAVFAKPPRNSSSRIKTIV